MAGCEYPISYENLPYWGRVFSWFGVGTASRLPTSWPGQVAGWVVYLGSFAVGFAVGEYVHDRAGSFAWGLLSGVGCMFVVMLAYSVVMEKWVRVKAPTAGPASPSRCVRA